MWNEQAEHAITHMSPLPLYILHYSFFISGGNAAA
ncbi:hypothetical protein M2103_002036 [Ereboglobus sp. PH5-5]|nr:hypothetical protein [Ereboglobus sp. PH5-10]MDF9833803.1 hypothetical protein [Ereboglobus sp. PH5-5]